MNNKKNGFSGWNFYSRTEQRTEELRQIRSHLRDILNPFDIPEKGMYLLNIKYV